MLRTRVKSLSKCIAIGSCIAFASAGSVYADSSAVIYNFANKKIDPSPRAVSYGTHVTLHVTHVNRLKYDVLIEGKPITLNTTVPSVISSQILGQADKKQAEVKQKSGNEAAVGPPDTTLLTAQNRFHAAVTRLLKAKELDNELVQLIPEEAGIKSPQTIKDAAYELSKSLLYEGDENAAKTDKLGDAVIGSVVLERKGAELYQEMVRTHQELVTAYAGKLKAKRDAVIAIENDPKTSKTFVEYRSAKKELESDPAFVSSKTDDELFETIEKGKEDLQAKFKNAAKTYRALASDESYEITSDPVRATGDQLRFTVKVTTKPVSNQTPGKKEVSTSGQATGEDSAPVIVEIQVVNQWKIDFSSGIILHNLVDTTFTVQNKDVPDPQNPSATITTHEIIRGNQDSLVPAVGALTHMYWKFDSPIVPALSLGASVDTSGQTRFFLGGSLLMGSERRWVLTFGAAFGKVNRLSNGLQLGSTTKTQLATEDVRSVFRAGLFGGLTYNF